MAAGTKMPVGLVCCVLLVFPLIISAQVLTPPTLNLAQGRNITATATCGEGVSRPELYCRLVPNAGTSDAASPDTVTRRGQVCDHCIPGHPEKSHPPENAIDGTERWWQSPPLSRIGPELNKVNLTINLGQEYHVAYIFIKMANSPRPGVWVLERSTDFGKTFQPWQYFADTPSDCINFFNMTADEPLTRDDQVLCSTEYSKVLPLTAGEIPILLLSGRPNAENFTYATELQEWTKATDIRLRLLRTKTLLAHLMDLVGEDVSTSRRYYYSIKDITISGKCVCNGHAESCDVRDPNTQKQICDCVANTCGDKCEYCCPGFTQKRWQQALANQTFECEPCNCHGHTEECIFDEEVERNQSSLDIYGNYEGGGVCQNCRDNTEGINCEKCVFGYYRPYGVSRNATDACRECQCDLRVSTGECEEGSGRCLCRKEYAGINCDRCNFGYYGYPTCIPCDCDVNGTEGAVCQVGAGQCPCKYNFAGSKCDQCAPGFYNFPECTPCECNRVGSSGAVCDDETGQCPCRANYGARDCTECADGFFEYPRCTYCNCDPDGCEDAVCDKQTGDCLCLANRTGNRCDQCEPGFYNFPTCQECMCETPGSTHPECQPRSGQCRCQNNFGGRACDRCAAGYYKYPDCSPCNCDVYGSYGQSCDQVTGQCRCRSNFVGLFCDECGENFYNYPQCEVCNCNPDGAREVPGSPLGGCGVVTSGRLCECKEKVLGRICDRCMPGYWNLDRNNPEGCEECRCNRPGTLSDVNMCNTETGQCVCKAYVEGRDCNRCQNGFYNLQESNPFGCEGCKCNVGGSLRPTCDKVTGQCACKQRIGGKRCDQALSGHFVPDLHQYKYEVEDGRTPEGARVRYGYDEDIFPGFSWRGYAILTSITPEVIMDVTIRIPSLYQIIYKYVNRENETVKGTVTLSPSSPTDITQSGDLTFSPTTKPSFASVSSGAINAYVLNPGRWSISTSVPSNVYLDYFVLIPQSFYEASQLQERITDPCLQAGDDGPCRAFKYPDLSGFPDAEGKDGYHIIDGQRETIVISSDPNLTTTLDSTGLALLNENQKSFMLDLLVPRPDEYLIVVNYFNPEPRPQSLDVDVNTQTENTPATVTLSSCPFSTLCRQVLKGQNGLEGVFNISGGYATLTFSASDPDKDLNVAIDSVYAIPVYKWAPSYTLPRIICIKVNGICLPSNYGDPVGTIKIEFEADPNKDLLSSTLPPGIQDPTVGLVNLNDSTQLVEQTYCPISDDEADRECTTEMVLQAVPLELVGRITRPGDYVLVVHYYMSTGSELNIPVTVYTDGKPITGTFKPGFCPNLGGCRVAITFGDVDGTNVRLTGTDIRVVFNGTQGDNIWLDYLIIVPVRKFSPETLEILPRDNSEKFITECLDGGFQLKNTSDPFCLTGAFTLTTSFNQGALDCDCNPDGSVSFTCDRFGGNCMCKENVIGRECSACAQDYYGFPNCQPCNCPYGICHEVTGECICPPNVEGEKCDRCRNGAYDYDPIIGCKLCNCNTDGTVGGDSRCDQVTGQCNCKANVDGRGCDTCLAGYHSFPYCEDCGCDTRGTVSEICDQTTAGCLCKDNVVGEYCDQCDSGMFSLTEENPEGCIKCFCFGHTTRCDSAGLSWDKISTMKGWSPTNETLIFSETDNTLVLSPQSGFIEDGNIIWLAPANYTGNQMNSYGGKLEYTVFFTIAPNNSSKTDLETAKTKDVVISGGNMTITHRHNTHPTPNYPFKFEVELREYNFRHAESGNPVTRDQFMHVLHDVTVLAFRAVYYDVTTQIRLKDVSLQVASEDGQGELAESVEMCQCGPSYIGLSCESCSPGNYRARSNCVKCNCNGHSSDCDINTGECFNCQDNTTGPHCDQCLAGYYGDPATGACSICSCPLPIPSNNFAKTCQVSVDGYTTSCECQPGYTGANCDSCAAGYFGDPLREGDYCKRCSCSGNIDMRDPNSCDRFTGTCLLCDNYSGGPQCEQCREWFWGDAVVAKDCQACLCDRCGSDRCDNIHGSCECKDNVVGENCDRCAPNTWGFDYCSGCRDCECGVGAVSGQCDLRLGVCECKPGVEGDKCDRCQDNHWNYGPSGCEKCDCLGAGAVGCNSVTGRCNCLQGVTGDKCDRCLPRWVLVPNRGCQECDYCVHLLIDDLDQMNREVSVVSRTLDEVSVGVGAFNKLSHYNDTVEMLRPAVDILNNTDTDEFNSSLAMLTNNLKNLSKEARMLQDQSGFIAFEADELPKNVRSWLMNVSEVQQLTREGALMAEEVVQQIQDIYRSIKNSGAARNIEQYLTRSEAIVKEMEARDFMPQNGTCSAERDSAEDLKRQVSNLKMETISNLNRTKDLKMEVSDIEERLRDLDNSSVFSKADADSGMSVINRVRAVQLESLMRSLTKVKELTAEREEKLKDATMLLEKAEGLLVAAQSNMTDMESQSSRLDQAAPALEAYVDQVASEMDGLLDRVNHSQAHAESLKDAAAELEDLYENTRNRSQDPVTAGQAYQTIENAIAEARKSADKAIEDADSAKVESDGISDNVTQALVDSEVLLEQANELVQQTQAGLQKELEQAGDDVVGAEDNNLDVKDMLEAIKEEMEKLNGSSTKAISDAVTDKVNKTLATLSETERLSQSVIDKTPDMNVKNDFIVSNAPKAADDMRQTKDSLDSAMKSQPEVEDLVKSLSDVVDRVSEKSRVLGVNVDSLKEKIARARDEANRIKVGLRFLGNTTVTLRNPPQLKDTGSYSTTSMYLRTTQPDALLLYIGNNQNLASPDNSRMKRSVSDVSDLVEQMVEDEGFGAPLSRQVRQVPDFQSDYLALELESGKVVFTVNLGSGAVRVTSNKEVSDGQWHQIVAERIGKTVKLVVKSDGEEDDVAEGTTQGTYAVLELNLITTRILVGGLPDDFSLPRGLNTDSFEGGMEELRFDGEPLGLWNFVSAENNYEAEQQRDVMKQIFVEGVRFNGMGYSVLSKGDFRLRPDRTRVSLTFKTYAEEGLLFFMSANDYFVVEMQKGQVYFRFDLGGGPTVLKTQNKYNDGEWHAVRIDRNKRDAYMKMDDNAEELQTTASGNLNNLETTDDIYIGGIDNILLAHRSVTTVGFDGCMKDISIGTSSVNLFDNKRAKGLVNGCFPKITHIVSFPSKKMGYIGLPPVSVGGMFDLTFKMKTTRDTALLMMVSDQSQTNVFAVSMSEGMIVVGEQLGSVTNQLTSKINTYSDGEWHYISIMKMDQRITMNIDDTETVDAESVPGDLITDSPLYFGGLPSGFSVSSEAVLTTDGIAGCMGDITINKKFQNLAILKESYGVTLAECSMEKEEEEVPATLPPDLASTGECALPAVVSDADEDSRGSVEGLRYGSSLYSRQEYGKLPVRIMIRPAVISISFKTTAEHGVLFYAAGDQHTDFIGLHMDEGRLHYGFNCGSGAALITSPNSYNDGQWHTAKFTRRLKTGTLEVDGQQVASGNSRGSTRSLNTRAPYYVGGIRENVKDKAMKNLKNGFNSFPGCIKDVTLNMQDLGTPKAQVETRPCSDHLESGSFIGMTGGNIRILDKFTVGKNQEIVMQIRPRRQNGILLAVHSDKNDYLILQIAQGDVIFTIDNGAGPITVKYSPMAKNVLCDGNWHSIKASKMGNDLQLTVDGNTESVTGSGNPKVTAADTAHPLYLGGVGDSTAKGILATEGYMGCIRNVRIKNKVMDIAGGVPLGDVRVDACPKN